MKDSAPTKQKKSPKQHDAAVGGDNKPGANKPPPKQQNVDKAPQKEKRKAPVQPAQDNKPLKSKRKTKEPPPKKQR